jgi:hypothetical protein
MMKMKNPDPTPLDDSDSHSPRFFKKYFLKKFHFQIPDSVFLSDARFSKKYRSPIDHHHIMSDDDPSFLVLHWRGRRRRRVYTPSKKFVR